MGRRPDYRRSAIVQWVPIQVRCVLHKMPTHGCLAPLLDQTPRIVRGYPSPSSCIRCYCQCPAASNLLNVPRTVHMIGMCRESKSCLHSGRGRPVHMMEMSVVDQASTLYQLSLIH